MSGAAILAQVAQAGFEKPVIDWHALAPEIVLVVAAAVII